MDFKRHFGEGEYHQRKFQLNVLWQLNIPLQQKIQKIFYFLNKKYMYMELKLMQTYIYHLEE